ncbi:unnamed protein product [Schistocephalus solidus]|uniref:Secreted protein n=1 Tax=Schistocephalus solidus TaxID=70667 RepID=A0A183SLT3_SCHSO|nr:unnamed protein product [Schistocephalus solidus]
MLVIIASLSCSRSVRLMFVIKALLEYLMIWRQSAEGSSPISAVVTCWSTGRHNSDKGIPALYKLKFKRTPQISALVKASHINSFGFRNFDNHYPPML